MNANRIGKAWRRLWGSVSFRLTFNYSLLAAATTIIVLLFVYLQIVNLLQMQFSRQISLTAHRLLALYEQDGAPALSGALAALLSDQTDVDSEMYLLLDEGGRKLAGNLDPQGVVPADFDESATRSEAVLRDGMPREGFLRLQQLDNGWILVVGHDVRDLQEVKHLISQAMLVTTFVALLLVAAGTYVFRLALTWRVQDIRDTVRHVGTGELTRRVPDAQEEDEFAGLRNDINHMLDRIEALMSGVRNVSDSIAHNLRTPLARVLGSLHSAQHRRLDEAGQQEAIDQARREIMDLIAVTEKLLLIAEAESGVRRQSFQKLDLNRILEDAVDLFEPLAAEKNITLHLNCEANPQVWADADLLAGVVVNVIENSFKYAGPGAHISISAMRDGLFATLLIDDDGPGVDTQFMDQVGTRFYRLRPDAPGYGLGLASVRAIISLHEGQVWFEDAQPGFRVRIQLPCADR